ncbi:MAG TPA: zf-HC2 domain-containing protein [Verrucomicrobiae bacterium]|jgi:hypothetical protein|nr:zf-HC2 domain-containing protein [Verrucomicrobiae bacterium]
MDWNCLLTEDRLSDFLDGVLSTEEARAFSAHCSGCARCGPLVAQIGGLVKEMQSLGPVEEPPQLVARILHLTLGPRASRQGLRRRLAWVPRIWEPQFAMGVVTVAASFFMVFHSVGGGTNHLRRTNLNPVNMIRAIDRQAHLSYARAAKFVNDLRVVYEIESRLQPQPERPSEPSPRPEPPPEEKLLPPSPDPEQESRNPRPVGDSLPRNLLAALLERTSPGTGSVRATWSSR